MMNSSSKNVIREIDLQITTCKKIDREPNMRKLLTGLHITFKPERCTVWTTVVIERVMNKKRVVHRDQSQLLTTELCMLVEPQTITNTFIL